MAKNLSDSYKQTDYFEVHHLMENALLKNINQLCSESNKKQRDKIKNNTNNSVKSLKH